jgi:tRNA(Ile)-lysidine synthase
MLDRLTIERMRWAAGDRPVLVALSGGGDSVALLHFLVEELGAGSVRAAIVDHALREGSTADAGRAKSFAAALGVHAEVLTLIWPDGANRAQQAAREARYAALCACAREQKINVIAAGHNADDQAETVMMRAANGSSWRGLAGIAPFSFAPLWPEGRGVVLARPLLNARREELRAYLVDRGASWIEDPANANPTYERVRVRRRLSELEKQGFEPMRLVRLARRLRQRADELDAAALTLITRSANLENDVRVSRGSWRAPAEVRRRALSVLIAAASGASREPPSSVLEALELRVMAPAHRGSTHSGVVFQPTKDGVVLKREPAAIVGRADGASPLPHLMLVPGVETLWDGRYAVTASTPGLRLVPADTGYFTIVKDGEARDPAQDLTVRPLAAERIRHAFAPDINRAKP